MLSKAPRLPTRLRRVQVRGAVLVMCTWLAGITPAVADGITHARFTDPTTRYAHGVLGDTIEYGALELTIQGKTLRIQLPHDRVFEDLQPRLVDMDLDGSSEVIVVESQDSTGAQLAIYDSTGDKIAATPHIGTRFRWLAPIGAADLDGDGHIEIAYIDRPHLAKMLRIWRFQNGGLTEIATLPGLTNHRIGQDFITGGIRDCGRGLELIVVSADWHQIVSVSYLQGWTTEVLTSFNPQTMKQALNCSD
ncbi:FG-GAP repeat domain-containing protein [Ruegeria profundi]|uniref:Integrin n=1 Tax=Ruegeria profundi TaxID=1685378 RepID=A0A0X3TW45_9RHOB|nr:VCBS repeat-containing protein [Ruegeria profundi]KUJ79908.1 hypothetical protein AVO44_06965 [Ruegeria profundi]